MRTLLILVMMFIPVLAQADVYVCLDKETGEVKGTVDVTPEVVGEWAKTYTMKKADESYRGLASPEIKIQEGKLSKATIKEVAAIKVENENKNKEANKKAALDTLGLTENDLAKIKNL